MVCGEVLAATGDPVLALQFTGDRSLKLALDYMKPRYDRLEGAATLLDRTETPTKSGLGRVAAGHPDETETFNAMLRMDLG